MRLIDGDELMKSVLCITMTADGRIPLDTVLDRIQKAPEVTGWVSVEDRLPKNSCDVICYDCRINQLYFTNYSSRHKEFNVADDDDSEGFAIHPTHWMLLPELPEVKHE